jgi:hypothetical protein
MVLWIFCVFLQFVYSFIGMNGPEKGRGVGFMLTVVR